jgi:hypothetical protein
MEPRFTCGNNLECPEDFGPGFLGFYVVLPPKYQVPGVYPLGEGPTADSAEIQVGTLFVDDECNRYSDIIADDGVVEVLAIDSQCIAIDVRGVTRASNGVDPNGSGRALLCELQNGLSFNSFDKLPWGGLP